MLDVVLVTLGALVLLATLVDVIATVIGVSSGHGVVSAVTSRGTWRLFRRINGGRGILRRIAGPTIFIGITLVWAGLLISGWVLVFSPEGALVTNDAAGVGQWDRWDHASALIFGGSSPVVDAGGQPWSFVARLARFSGLGLASFGLAYALPVVGAVVAARGVAGTVHSLSGRDGVLESTARRDGDDPVIHLFLVNLAGEISDLVQRVHAYPILPFFHASDTRMSLSVQMRELNRFLDSSVGSETVPESVKATTRQAIDQLLDLVERHYLPGGAPRTADHDRSRSERLEAWCRHDGWELENEA